MKSATTLLLAGAAAAHEHGYGYPAPSPSPKLGYTTIHPGYGKPPVTVTAQYQPIPTYVADKSDSKTGTWGEYAYVSTVLNDYDGKRCTITKTEEPVTVYHTKTTITHTSTEYGYAVPTSYSEYNKNTSDVKVWYELYEKVHEVPYKDLGPHALPGYPGSGLYKGDEDKQPVKVKEYKGGKWSEYSYVFSYGVPEPKVTTYEHPGTYTVPAYDITINKPTTVPAEATCTAKAGEPVTYGGITTTVYKATTITAPYGAYETEVKDSYTETKIVIHYTTITCPHAGTYEVVKPTTTSYDKDTEVSYPTAKPYAPGVYHHSEETVTITKSNEPYTCKYEKTSAYPMPTASSYATPSKYEEKPYPTPSGYATPSNIKADPYPTPSGYATPSKYEDETYPTPGYAAPSEYEPEPYPTPSSYATPSVYEPEPYPTPSSYATPSAYEPEPYPTPSSYATPSAYEPEPYPTPSSYATPSKYEPEPYPTPSTTEHPTYPTPVTPAPYGPKSSPGYGKPAKGHGKPYGGYVKRRGIVRV